MTTSVQLLTWTRVRIGGSPPSCVLKEVGPDREALVAEHVRNLVARIGRGTTPAAEFKTPADEERFARLADGTEDDFLAASTELAAAVQSHMKGNAKSGLFVTARLRIDNAPGVGAFKLDISETIAGILREDPKGDDWQAVKNLLETPTTLQKGAVTPDPRRDSAIVIGDKLSETAMYFLDGLGIRQAQRAQAVAPSILEVVAQAAPEAVPDVIAALPTTDATTPDELLAGIPSIEPAKRAEIVTMLSALPRPVRQVTATAVRKLRAVYRAGPIKVEVPLAMRGQVSTERTPEGQWILRILLNQEPRESFE